MEEPPRPPPKRPTITLKRSTPSVSAAVPSSPAASTPSGGPAKIKLVRKSLPSAPTSTPRAQAPKLEIPQDMEMPPPPPRARHPLPEAGLTTKSGRTMKMSEKKRASDAISSDDDAPPVPGTNLETQRKKIKVKGSLTSATPGRPKTIGIKIKKASGQPPPRPLGDGYDSEAEDREVDPVIEEQFVLRMTPGPDCDYLRKMIQERKLGVPKKDNGADVQLKWLDETRRCMITIQGRSYGAMMVDLPTITESLKSWDKKQMVKSADICQMMLVVGPVKNEEEAKTISRPKPVDEAYRWPHGLTPPMHDCRNRRFRKRLSKVEIQNKEKEVERLLQADKDAISSTIEFVEGSDHEGGEEMDDEDAEGEPEDYFGDAEMGEQVLEEDEYEEVDEAALEAEFEAAPDTPAPVLNPTPQPASAVDVLTPATATAATNTPAAQTEESAAEGEEEDDDEEDDEDEEDENDEEGADVNGDADDDERARDASIRASIANLKKQLAKFEGDLLNTTSPILRKRLEGQIKNIKAELDLKKRSIGEIDDD